MVPTYEGEEGGDTPTFVERERKKYWEYFGEVVRAALAVHVLRREAELHWQTAATVHFDALDQLARQLRGAVMAYFQNRMRAVSGQPESARYAADVRRIVFNPRLTETDADPYGDALDEAIGDALEFFKHRAAL